LALAVFLLDYRDKMAKNIKLIKDYKNEVNHLNQQLDEVNETLKSLDEPLSKISHFASRFSKKSS
ncbi:MAG: hypothetical protein LUH02_12555, partial [Erysipelotrichaceae bacterium]|nr:hypothetical protein [Erysipelotrichaceae bacterium]